MSEPDAAALSDRLFETAVMLWDQELKSDLANLRGLSQFSSMAAFAVEYLQSMPTPARNRLARALIRRAHSGVAGARGEVLGAEDDLILSAMADALVLSAAFRPAKSPRVDRGILRRSLRSTRPPSVSEDETTSRANRLMFVSHVSDWTIRTAIDTGGRTHYLGLDSAVWKGAQFLRGGLSTLTVMGIGTTTFDRVGGSEPDIATVVWDITQRFTHSLGLLDRTSAHDRR